MISKHLPGFDLMTCVSFGTIINGVGGGRFLLFSLSLALR